MSVAAAPPTCASTASRRARSDRTRRGLAATLPIINLQGVSVGKVGAAARQSGGGRDVNTEWAMPSETGSEQDSVRLSESSAAALLARATQLDAARAGTMSVAELRDAAREAGIAPEAFEQALGELRVASVVAADAPAVRPRRRRYWFAGLMVAVVLIILISRMFPEVGPVVPLP
jgi:hypothetical protein